MCKLVIPLVTKVHSQFVRENNQKADCSLKLEESVNIGENLRRNLCINVFILSIASKNASGFSIVFISVQVLYVSVYFV